MHACLYARLYAYRRLPKNRLLKVLSTRKHAAAAKTCLPTLTTLTSTTGVAAAHVDIRGGGGVWLQAQLLPTVKHRPYYSNRSHRPSQPRAQRRGCEDVPPTLPAP